MVKILLEYADNGIIKTVSDDNSNGAGDIFESKKVYEFGEEPANDSFCRTIEFFFDLAGDLDINVGNGHERGILVMNTDWGSSYNPSKKEVEDRIKSLKAEIAHLQQLKK